MLWEGVGGFLSKQEARDTTQALAICTLSLAAVDIQQTDTSCVSMRPNGMHVTDLVEKTAQLALLVVANLDGELLTKFTVFDHVHELIVVQLAILVLVTLNDSAVHQLLQLNVV